jgi:hypothetical protein
MMGVFQTPRLLAFDGKKAGHMTLFSSPITAYLGQGGIGGLEADVVAFFSFLEQVWA